MSTLDLTVDEVLTTTRSVRKRLDMTRSVDRAVVEECLEIALQAPSGGNLSSWRWLLIDDRRLIGELARLYRASSEEYAGRASRAEQSQSRHDKMMESGLHLARVLDQMPVMAIPLIAGRVEGLSAFGQATQWGSVLPAAWSFMLALRSRGLGSTWTTIHLKQERAAAEVLGVPFDRYTQAGLFPVAHTVGTDFKKALRKPLAEIAFWNGFAPGWR
jgi:nitroreductase